MDIEKLLLIILLVVPFGIFLWVIAIGSILTALK